MCSNVQPAEGQAPIAVPRDISDLLAAFSGDATSPVSLVENTPYRKENDGHHENAQTPTAQGVEGGFLPLEGAIPSLFSNCQNPHAPHEAPSSATQGEGVRENVVPRVPLSKHVAARDDHAVMCAVDHARRIGRRLNMGLTLALPHIQAAGPEDRPALQKAERDALRVWFNDQADQLTFIWNRASLDQIGTGEHCHLLLHVPASLRKSFVDFVDRRWGTPAAKLHPASDAWWIRRDGKAQSWQSYCLQGVHHERAKRQNRVYRYGGWIKGKRTGLSLDIGPQAIARWEVAQGIVNR